MGQRHTCERCCDSASVLTEYFSYPLDQTTDFHTYLFDFGNYQVGFHRREISTITNHNPTLFQPLVFSLCSFSTAQHIIQALAGAICLVGTCRGRLGSGRRWSRPFGVSGCFVRGKVEPWDTNSSDITSTTRSVCFAAWGKSISFRLG